jgi:TRAP-type C4-dicarboxylate transport system substrate-binding protein
MKKLLGRGKKPFMALFLASAVLWPVRILADEITLKLGSLGPAGTSATSIVDTLKDYLKQLAEHTGHKAKLIPYYGGVMGDEPEMNQKAKMGQLDIVTPTVSTLPELAPNIEPLYLPFLIENYGQYDYVMRQKFLKEVSNQVYEHGFIVVGLLTEGMHNMYQYGMAKNPVKKLEQMRSRIKGGNWTGTPDEMFYKALGISQVSFSVPEGPSAIRMGMANATLSPAMWVIGTQLYTTNPAVIQPPIRGSSSAALITRAKFEALPWNFKLAFASAMPAITYFACGQLRDSHDVFLDAMYKYGCPKVVLTDQELKGIKEPCINYRQTYLKENPKKRGSYEILAAALKDYAATNSIEKRLFESDPIYKTFPKKVQKLVQALKAYGETGDKSKLASLESENVIENWRILGLIDASETLIQKDDPSLLKAWMAIFMPQAFVEEAFSAHMAEMKETFGKKEALMQRIEEMASFLGSKAYKGYHKGA